MLSTPNDPEMTANDTISIVQLFERHHLNFYIDGGWGVDALLGKQTRTHADLDIAIQYKDVAQIRSLLEARGYKDLPRNDTSDYNFVLGDNQGHQIDIHSYTFDLADNNVYGVAYPFDSLTGTGSVNGHPVKCISPEWMVKFHCGYKFDENDYYVKALCQRFNIIMPLEYKEFENNNLIQIPAERI
jgi:lincosamide nucleotidyltransferase A/C/D/E